MKLINVDEAIKRIKEIDAGPYKLVLADAEAIISFLEEQPVLDVVHCCDCKYFINSEYTHDGQPMCNSVYGLPDIEGQSFCCFGERKDS